MLEAGALGGPRGMVWGGRREEGSGWGTHVYLWQIHFDIWQNQYNIVKLKKKKRLEFLIYLMNTCRLVDSSENRPHIQPTVSLGLDMVTDMQA